MVFNSFSNVLTQDDQVRAFENVAAHLADDGVFVMEIGLPSVLVGMRNDQYVEAEAIGVDEVRLDLLRYDGSTQILEENHVTLSATGIRFNPVVQRYAWPAELDLMARIAGLRLHARYGGWSRRALHQAQRAPRLRLGPLIRSSSAVALVHELVVHVSRDLRLPALPAAGRPPRPAVRRQRSRSPRRSAGHRRWRRWS